MVLDPPLAGPIRPAMDLPHRPDRPGPEPFAGQPQPLARVAVVAHLGHQARLLRHAGHDPRLLDRVGHRLLDVHMLAGPHRGQADRRVHVVGSGDHHGVDVASLIEQHAIIAELLGVREVLEGAGRLDPVHVAQRDDVLAGHLLDDAPALPSHADPGDVQLLARRDEPPPQHMPGHHMERERGRPGRLEESPSLHHGIAPARPRQTRRPRRSPRAWTTSEPKPSGAPEQASRRQALESGRTSRRLMRPQL